MSRTLRDCKKNLEISQYFLNIFYAFSNFTEYHPFLLQNLKIGDTCVLIIENEVERYKSKVGEFMRMKKQLDAAQKTPSGDVNLEAMMETMKKEEKRLKLTIIKQEKVLFVAIHILLNLAEDLQIERKMKNRNIVKLLLTLVDRNNPDLIYICLNFLKKLSVFGQNKNDMVECDVIKKINRFIPC